MLRRSPVGKAAVILLTVTAIGQSAPPPETIFKDYRPKQKDVDYETPKPEDFAKCKVELEKRGNSEGYVTFGPDGQVLRRFLDANGKGRVNEFRYYNHGIEVYRETDTNGNNKPDQFRWLNLGGSRWGIDSNEDGKIDAWKSISAAEASREAIRAMTSGDEAALAALMITAEDLKSLGVEKEIATKLLTSAREAPKKATAIMSKKSKVLTPQSKWMKFEAVMPGVIPADDGKANQDLHVYENAMVIVETGKDASKLVQIGEMVRVGDAWKLTQAPLPIEEGTPIVAGGVLMQPTVSETGAGATASISPELQKLLDELQKLDEKPPATDDLKALAKYNNARADLLIKIFNLAESEEEKTQYMKQLVQGLSAMVQTGAFPQGLDRIKDIEKSVRKSSSKTLIPYVTYQRIFAEYTVDLQKAKAEARSEVMQEWLKGLETFIKEYPDAEDVPDAMLHLAMNDEFMGKAKEAKAWYEQIVKEYEKSAAANKARGAITRINLKGKAVNITGPGLTGGSISTASMQGKVVLVMFWATWCQPCTEDLPDLRALYNQYGPKGFEIVGISLDMNKDDVPKFLTAQKVPWKQIYQPGGLESPLAVQFGVFSPPVMILIDKDGKVVSKNATVAELKSTLPLLYK